MLTSVAPSGPREEAHVILLRDGEECAFLVDDLEDVVRVPLDAIWLLPPLVARTARVPSLWGVAQYVLGEGEQGRETALVVLVDLVGLAGTLG